MAAILEMNPIRLHRFRELYTKTIRFGSDCSGADAAGHAGKTWVPGIFVNSMMSEAPKAYGPILFALLNNPPERFFMDLLSRGFSGPDLMNDFQLSKAPSNIEFYSSGSMCTDFSKFNTHNPKESLGPTRHFYVSFLVLDALSLIYSRQASHVHLRGSQGHLTNLIHSDHMCLLPLLPMQLRFGNPDGISTQTFENSLAYIAMLRPKTFIFEMVWKPTIRQQFLETITETCPWYALWSGVLNSAALSHSSRPRFYIVGVDVTQVMVH